MIGKRFGNQEYISCIGVEQLSNIDCSVLRSNVSGFPEGNFLIFATIAAKLG